MDGATYGTKFESIYSDNTETNVTFTAMIKPFTEYGNLCI